MKNFYSNIINSNPKNLNKIIKILKKNGIISLPTETVYGLAGNAYSNISIKKIFNIKKRLKKNPLIIHYYSLNDAKKDVILDKKFYAVYRKFSPGPLTYILKKKKNSRIKPIACANLKTVGVRFPNNKIIRKILKKLNFPLAMPSANKSSSVSPVKPSDVSEEFNNKILVVDGGISKIGIESTVLNLVGKISILRPGKITPKQIENILKTNVKVSLKTLVRHLYKTRGVITLPFFVWRNYYGTSNSLDGSRFSICCIFSYSKRFCANSRHMDCI